MGSCSAGLMQSFGPVWSRIIHDSHKQVKKMQVHFNIRTYSLQFPLTTFEIIHLDNVSFLGPLSSP